MNESEQQHIFDPFFRRRGGGSPDTPLGLALCREIVSLHDGKIGVLSRPESTEVEFFFDLRCAP